MSDVRVGTGFDAHAFDASKQLFLAGLLWENQPGLVGHSDGDAVIHAIVDALLGAAGLGDIGTHFGTSNPEYAGARSEIFLSRTVAMLAEAGWAVANVSAQLICERPRMSNRRIEAQDYLSQIVGAPVSVTATSTDGMGFTGRGEGVAVFATALITRHNGSAAILA